MQVLEISQAEWSQADQPSNVLVIPSQPLNTNPHIPGRPNFTVKEYEQGGPCPDGASAIALIHDANSGWWFEYIDIRAYFPLKGYDGTIYDNVHDYLQKTVETQINQSTGQPLPFDDPLAVYTWAQPPGWDGTYNWDFWTISCDTDYILIQTKLKPPPITPPPPTPPPTGPPPPTPPPTTDPCIPDIDGDELTNDFCAQLQCGFDKVVAALGGAMQNPDCCALLVTALDDIDITLGGITNNLNLIATASTKPIDWTPVVNGLANIANKLGFGGVDLTPLIGAIQGGAGTIADAIAATPKPEPFDQTYLKEIAEGTAATRAKVKQFVQVLIDAGIMNPALAQVLTS